jgi:hypothetical protein
MLGLFLFYITLAYIMGTGNTVFVRKDMLLGDIMIGNRPVLLNSRVYFNRMHWFDFGNHIVFWWIQANLED